MKKVFAIAFISAATLVACNSASETKPEDVKTDAIENKLDEIKDTAASKMEEIKDTAASKMGAIKDTVAAKVEEIKK
jgi:ABC-type transporter MlaC component